MPMSMLHELAARASSAMSAARLTLPPLNDRETLGAAWAEAADKLARWTRAVLLSMRPSSAHSGPI